MNYPHQSRDELNEVREVTEAAVAQSFENAQNPWKEYAMHCVSVIAKQKEYFTVNDVRPLVEASPYTTQDNRALGGVIKAAQKRGWIEPSGEERVNKTGHGTKMQVWKSRIFGETVDFVVPTTKEKKYRTTYKFDAERNCMVEIKEEIND